jgi:hypothetical protein
MRPLGVPGEPLPKVFRLPKVKKGLRPRNPERAARLEERNFGEHGAFIRLRPCIVHTHVHPSLQTPCLGQIVAAHLVPRGMGGCNGDRFSLFPACVGHHGEQEGRTAEFQETYQLDLAALVETFNLADPSLSDEEREAARLRLAVLSESR